MRRPAGERLCRLRRNPVRAPLAAARPLLAAGRRSTAPHAHPPLPRSPAPPRFGVRVNTISAGPLGSRAAKAIGFIDDMIR